ncbi:MAG: TrkH family potassium uptake protein [Acidimicrobiia bacterium]|nr:MAG: TrkH family potassium uptake protein [Acidimicrobiia bacterium]
MLIRPAADDLRTVGSALGRVFIAVAAASGIPIVWALVGREWNPLGSFILMAGVFAVLGTTLMQISVPPSAKIKADQRHLDWSHGMVVVAITWLVVPLIGSIPFIFSGHYGSAIDAYFDAMSGLSTTGLSLVQDLDHLASSLNFWRHLLHFLGGQGIIIAALLLFAGRGMTTLFQGEGREDRVLPSVQSTAKAIWAVSLLHLVVGVAALGLVASYILGFSWHRALFHALMIFFAAFDTGGFAPQSTSIGYYHSAIFESVTAVLMVAGALSFGFHFRLWSRADKRLRRRTLSYNLDERDRPNRWSLLKNLETRSIVTTFGITMFFTIIGLAAIGMYSSVAGLSRQGFFQILSAHTGTGFTTVPSSELVAWSGLAFGGIAMAMALGGMASSTAGGVKAMRVGLIVRAIVDDVKGDLLPEDALVDNSYYQFGRHRLTPEVARSAMVVTLLFVALFLTGAGIGIAYGVPLQQALFESVSAGANVGLSVGVTSPAMPALLKLTYILQMYLGRLEFVAVFVLIGFAYSLVRGR